MELVSSAVCPVTPVGAYLIVEKGQETISGVSLGTVIAVEERVNEIKHGDKVFYNSGLAFTVKLENDKSSYTIVPFEGVLCKVRPR